MKPTVISNVYSAAGRKRLLILADKFNIKSLGEMLGSLFHED